LLGITSSRKSRFHSCLTSACRSQPEVFPPEVTWLKAAAVRMPACPRWWGKQGNAHRWTVNLSLNRAGDLHVSFAPGFGLPVRSQWFPLASARCSPSLLLPVKSPGYYCTLGSLLGRSSDRALCYYFRGASGGHLDLEETDEAATQVSLCRPKIVQLLLPRDLDRAPLVGVRLHHRGSLRRNSLPRLHAALLARFSLDAESYAGVADFLSDLRMQPSLSRRWRSRGDCDRRL